MSVPTLFVSRANIALSRDTALLILGGPAGPIKDGEVQIVEIARLAMSHETLRAIAALLTARVADMPAEPQKPLSPTPRARTPRGFRDRAEDEGLGEDERESAGKFTTH